MDDYETVEEEKKESYSFIESEKSFANKMEVLSLSDKTF